MTLNILALIAPNERPSAVEVYRITTPFSYMNNLAADIECAWMSMEKAAEIMTEKDPSMVFDHDIITIARRLSWDEDVHKMITACRSMGAKVVYELDDDYTGETGVLDPGGTCEWLKGTEAINGLSAITVSTKHLKERMDDFLDERVPIYVVPNAISYQAFSGVSLKTKRQVEGLSIMLAGTNTHYEDWRVMADVIPEIQRRHPDVKFIAAANRDVYDYLVEAGVEFLAPVYYTRYPSVLRQADILCAPLLDTEFNRSKSPIKAIEGWAAARPVSKTHAGGCAIVASDHSVYRGAVQNRHNGLLVKHTPEAWVEGLDKLISDRFLRQKLQVNGLKEARKHDIEKLWTNWQRVYQRIAGG